MLNALRKVSIPARFWGLMSVFFCCLLFLLFQGGKLAFMVFIMVLVLTVYLSLGTFSGIKKATGRRALTDVNQETALEAGSSVQVTIRVNIPGFWPIPYVLLKDRLLRRGGDTQVYESTFVPDWKRRGHLSYMTPPLPRGFYTFGEANCSTEDIFGFFEHKGTLTMPLSFSVLPRTVHIREWSQFHMLTKGNQHLSTTTRSPRETTQINGVREYIYGDRLSRIHWNATARTGTWKSKEFEREALPKLIIVLDRNTSSYRTPGQFELAVSVTASLLQFAHSQSLAAGLLSVGKDQVYFEPGLGHGNHKAMSHHLIEVNPDGKFEVMQVIADRSRQLPAGSMVAVVSPKAGGTLMQALTWADNRHMTPVHFQVEEAAYRHLHGEWSRMLKARGFAHYLVAELHELPVVLGGAIR